MTNDYIEHDLNNNVPYNEDTKADFEADVRVYKACGMTDDEMITALQEEWNLTGSQIAQLITNN